MQYSPLHELGEPHRLVIKAGVLSDNDGYVSLVSPLVVRYGCCSLISGEIVLCVVRGKVTVYRHLCKLSKTKLL